MKNTPVIKGDHDPSEFGNWRAVILKDKGYTTIESEDVPLSEMVRECGFMAPYDSATIELIEDE